MGGPSGPIAAVWGGFQHDPFDVGGGHAREGQVAQLVEQRTENPRVGGSIPPLATISNQYLRSNPTRLHCFKNVPGAHLVPTSIKH